MAPAGMRVRPTLDRVRESLFNILGPRIERARFLDLFAGTGANGIEALSRGASACTFVDNHPQSLACIRRNLEAARLSELAVVQRVTLPGGLKGLASEGNSGQRGSRERSKHEVTGPHPYDIVFADPPYEFAQYDALLTGLVETGLLATSGLVIVEHAVQADALVNSAPIARSRRVEYGDTALSFFA